MRLLAYTDYVYRREGGALFAERAFALFLARLADEFERLTIVGRVDDGLERAHFRLPDAVRFVALPTYPNLTRPSAVKAMARSLRRYWKACADVDAVWLLGPHPLAIAFALIAAARGKRVVLGVRQDLPRYVRNRHPASRWVHTAADLLEAIFRAFTRRFPVVVVGPELAHNYRAARHQLEIEVSLVREADIIQPESIARSYDDDVLRVLSVGRLESEKNPLLLADVLAELRRNDGRWSLTVCGEGPLESDLRDRFAELGVGDAVIMKGYVPITGGLSALYRESHAFLHVSWTEGMPQVLLEAFAACAPVVATAVGGVERAVGHAALLIPPGDPQAAASALRRIAGEPPLREGLVAAGHEHVATRTIDAECRRVAAFIRNGT